MANEITIQVGTKVARVPLNGTAAEILSALKDYALSLSMPIADDATGEQIAEQVLQRMKEDVRLGARRVRLQRKLDELRRQEADSTTGDI